MHSASPMGRATCCAPRRIACGAPRNSECTSRVRRGQTGRQCRTDFPCIHDRAFAPVVVGCEAGPCRCHSSRRVARLRSTTRSGESARSEGIQTAVTPPLLTLTPSSIRSSLCAHTHHATGGRVRTPVSSGVRVWNSCLPPCHLARIWLATLGPPKTTCLPKDDKLECF